MASITSLLLTDSLSSSRIILNDNFNSINNQVNDIADLLDVSAQTLTLTGSMTGGSLNVNGYLVANSTDVIATVPVTLQDSLTLEAGMVHSVANGITTLPTSYTKTTYIVDSSAFTGAQTIQNSVNDGQEVTFIADGGDFTIDSTNIAGATANPVIHSNGTMTLRYYNTLWYVISYANATVTF